MQHGAAAVIRAINEHFRFLVWDGYQLHSDIGERLGLAKKRSQTEFTTLCAAPGNKVHVAAGTSHQTLCLCDICPPDYGTPTDWDVLGN